MKQWETEIGEVWDNAPDRREGLVREVEDDETMVNLYSAFSWAHLDKDIKLKLAVEHFNAEVDRHNAIDEDSQKYPDTRGTK